MVSVLMFMCKVLVSEHRYVMTLELQLVGDIKLVFDVTAFKNIQHEDVVAVRLYYC